MAETPQAPSNTSGVTSDAERAYTVSDAELAQRWGMTKPEAPAIEKEVVEQKPNSEAPLEKVPVEEPVVAKEEETVEAPVEEVAEEPEPEEEAPEPRQLITKFQVFDERGELEVPTNLKFAFKANGKDYEDVEIDKLVSLAQMGVYNHEKEQRVSQAMQEALQAKQELEAYREAVAKYDQYVTRMLQDPDYREAAAEEFQRQNTPEARLEAERANLERERRQMLADRDSQAVQMFTETKLTPYLSNLLEQNPAVTQYELMGLFSEMMAPMLVRGRVPVERLADVERAVATDLTTKVKSLQTERTLKEAKRSKEVESTKKELIQTKRTVARTAAPSGRVAPDAPKLKDVKSASDWFNDRFGG